MGDYWKDHWIDLLIIGGIMLAGSFVGASLALWAWG